jgi:hypothetical protein
MHHHHLYGGLGYLIGFQGIHSIDSGGVHTIEDATDASVAAVGLPTGLTKMTRAVDTLLLMLMLLLLICWIHIVVL